jgi:hypothetical protein
MVVRRASPACRAAGAAGSARQSHAVSAWSGLRSGSSALAARWFSGSSGLVAAGSPLAGMLSGAAQRRCLVRGAWWSTSVNLPGKAAQGLAPRALRRRPLRGWATGQRRSGLNTSMRIAGAAFHCAVAALGCVVTPGA